MAASPWVSVVIPTRNRAEWIARTLDSVLAQSHRPLQIVVVDNGSTDQTLARVARWAQQLPPDVECLVLSEPQPGASRARNRGWQAARGEWIAHFDDDDEMSPDFIERMLHTAACHPDARWVLARARMVMPDGCERVRRGWACPSLAAHILGSFVSTQSFVVQRSLLAELGGWDESLPVWNDYELGMRLLLHSAPAWDDGIYHRIYQHGASLTSTPAADKLPAMARALARMADHLRAAHAPATAHRALYLRAQIESGRWQNAQLELTDALYSSPPFPLRLLGRFLRQYVALGGRGAWQIALTFCR